MEGPARDKGRAAARRTTDHKRLIMNRRFGGDVSLNAPVHGDGESAQWQDWLVDEAPSSEGALAASQEFDERHQALGEALTVLSDRERRIFEARRLAGEPATLDALAAEFGASRERVRQIEARAFEKVQKAVMSRAVAPQIPSARGAGGYPALALTL
jgi:RNA polymerase sigma-32 factor